jgi:hypothetical protein
MERRQLRISYKNGKLFLNLTKEEVKEVSKNKDKPIELDIGNIRTLNEDISNIVIEYWKDVEVPIQVKNLKNGNDSY